MGFCPHYKQGVCYSPILIVQEGKPVDWVTSKDRCINNFKSCKFFEPVNQETIVNGKKNSHWNINLLNDNPISACPFFKSLDNGNGKYVVHCQGLNRYLTFSEVNLCINYWSSCPIARSLNFKNL